MQTALQHGPLHVAAVGGLQSVSCMHCGTGGHAVCDSLHWPMTQMGLGHELVPSAHATQACGEAPQSVSFTHCGVGQLGYVTWHCPSTHALVAHFCVPSTQVTQEVGGTGQPAVESAAAAVQLIGLHTGALTPHAP